MRQSALLFLTVALLGSPLLLAQDSREIFEGRVDVEVINVGVIVADRDGTPVRNLGVDDFRLDVDGKKVKIQYFDPPAEDVGGRESVVLLIDNRHLDPALRNQALEVLEAPLLRLAEAGVEIKVVAYSGVLQVLQSFTTEATGIRIALARATRSGTEASKRMWEARQVAVGYVVNNLRSFPRSPPQELIEQTSKAVMSQLEGFARFENQDAKEFLDSMQLMVAALGGVEGHKTVLLMSDGFAVQPADVVFNRFARAGKRLSQTDPTAAATPLDGAISGGPAGQGFTPRSGFSESVAPGGLRDWRRGYDDLKIVDDVLLLTRIANTGGVTIHALPLTPTFQNEVERGQQVDLGQDRFVVSDLDYSLQMIARETGGRAHDRADDLAAFLEQTVAEIPSSYSLGFTPREADGEYHELKVRVKGRGLRVRHRPGYVSRVFNQRFAARTIAAVMLDLVDNPHELGIEIQGMEPLENGFYQVAIVAHFPIAKIDLTFDGTNHFADLWIAATYLDAGGRVGDLQQAQAPLMIPEADLQGALEQKSGAVLHLRMQAGSRPTGVGLWNRTTGRGSFIAGNVDVRPPAAEDVQPPAEEDG